MNHIEQWYGNPALRLLVSMLPKGHVIDLYLTSLLDKYFSERRRTFFDELSAGQHQLTPQVIENEEFLHNFFATVQAATNTRNRAKIRYFARLLLGSVPDSESSRTPVIGSEYEDLLRILSELTVRELYLLALLARYETQFPLNEVGEEAVRAEQFWNAFEDEATTALELSPAEFAPTLLRLARTGVYESFNGRFLPPDEVGWRGRGNLTALYWTLEMYIRSMGDLEDGSGGDLEMLLSPHPPVGP